MKGRESQSCIRRIASSRPRKRFYDSAVDKHGRSVVVIGCSSDHPRRRRRRREVYGQADGREEGRRAQLPTYTSC